RPVEGGLFTEQLSKVKLWRYGAERQTVRRRRIDLAGDALGALSRRVLDDHLGLAGNPAADAVGDEARVEVVGDSGARADEDADALPAVKIPWSLHRRRVGHHLLLLDEKLLNLFNDLRRLIHGVFRHRLQLRALARLNIHPEFFRLGEKLRVLRRFVVRVAQDLYPFLRSSGSDEHRARPFAAREHRLRQTAFGRRRFILVHQLEDRRPVDARVALAAGLGEKAHEVRLDPAEERLAAEEGLNCQSLALHLAALDGDGDLAAAGITDDGINLCAGSFLEDARDDVI